MHTARPRHLVRAISSIALLTIAASTATTDAATANAVTLTSIGADPYTNATSQHATQVEPD